MVARLYMCGPGTAPRCALRSMSGDVVAKFFSHDAEVWLTLAQGEARSPVWRFLKERGCATMRETR
jgi:hypothetical protein